jgi:hypothetical protein
LPSGARASSDDAWTAFRASVSTACTASAKKEYANPVVVVGPFGSETYGVALVYARTPVGKNSPPENSITTAELSGGFLTGPSQAQ